MYMCTNHGGRVHLQIYTIIIIHYILLLDILLYMLMYNICMIVYTPVYIMYAQNAVTQKESLPMRGK